MGVVVPKGDRGPREPDREVEGWGARGDTQRTMIDYSLLSSTYRAFHFHDSAFSTELRACTRTSYVHSAGGRVWVINLGFWVDGNARTCLWSENPVSWWYSVWNAIYKNIWRTPWWAFCKQYFSAIERTLQCRLRELFSNIRSTRMWPQWPESGRDLCRLSGVIIVRIW